MRKTRDEQKLEAETCLIRSYVESLLRACPRERREVVLHVISPISVKLCQFKGSTPKLKKTNWFLFWFFPVGDRPPPVFLGFHQGNRLKISEMYEALTFDSFKYLTTLRSNISRCQKATTLICITLFNPPFHL